MKFQRVAVTNGMVVAETDLGEVEDQPTENFKFLSSIQCVFK